MSKIDWGLAARFGVLGAFGLGAGLRRLDRLARKGLAWRDDAISAVNYESR